MKRVSLFVVLAYVVFFIILTWPVLLVSFYDPDKNFPNANEVLSCFKAPVYWIFLGVVALCQAGLLFIPVKMESRRPMSKNSVYLPIIVSGFLIGAVVLGIICSLNELLQKEATFGKSWEGWTTIGFCVIIWMIWSFIFCRLTSGQEPKSIVLRQCRHLLQGSVIALLVAVPTHIVARHRGYCCAGVYTFIGISFGLAVLLLSFGPSVYFLYAERWRKLHPESKDANVGEDERMINNQQVHDAEIVDQFTKQAIPFTELPGHIDSIQMLIEMSKTTCNDTVLDVACGPGMVACEFAKVACHVTGIDITQKMIEQARKRQKEFGLDNLSWDIGTVLPLPYASEMFSVVITRYSFHHFLDPKAVLSEMYRVCRPGGVVLVADAVLPADRVDAYNRMEKLRDPSHTQVLSFYEWEKLIRESGLKNLRRASYKVEMELEKQLKSSFPKPGDDEKIRNIFRNDIEINSLGMDVHLEGNEIHFSYPISIYVGNK